MSGIFFNDNFNEDDDDNAKRLPPVIKPSKRVSAKLKSERGRRFEDNYDIIYEAYTNPRKMDKLTPTIKRELARWKFARQWISDFEPSNDGEVVRALRTEYGISERQAYTDVQNCKRLFASVTKVNAEFEKVMFLERLTRTRRYAMELGNAKGFAIATRCDAILAKVNGYDREQHELPQPVLVNVVMTTDISVLGLKEVENKEALIKSFWKKKDAARAKEIQDIEYEDLLENPRDERQHQR